MFLYANNDPGRSHGLNNARNLLLPLGVSLALHALVFWSAPELSPSPEQSASRQNKIRASLYQKPAATPIEKPLFSPPPSAETTPPRQPENPVAPLPDSATASEDTVATPVEKEYAETPPNPPIEPVRSGIDLAGLREYHLALGQKARQFRRYPEEARAAGGGGRVTMRLFISENGSPLGVTLLGSSGFPVLDRAALEMMLLSASHTEVPATLRGRSFNIDLAIDYNPNETP